jgi:hypothetical protein
LARIAIAMRAFFFALHTTFLTEGDLSCMTKTGCPNFPQLQWKPSSGFFCAQTRRRIYENALQ